MAAEILFYIAATQKGLHFIFLRGFIWNKHLWSIPLKVLYAKWKKKEKFCLFKNKKMSGRVFSSTGSP